MQVGTGRPAGRADIPDDVAAHDALPLADAEAAQMAVASRQSEVVGEYDQVAVFACAPGRFDGAVSCRIHRLAPVGGDVDALVKTRFTGKGIAAAAERAGQPAVRWPDRGGCGRQR